MSTYTLRTDQLLDQEGIYHTVYGINLIDPDNLQICQSIPNIFCDLNRAEEFLALINRLELSPVRLWDVIEDLFY